MRTAAGAAVLTILAALTGSAAEPASAAVSDELVMKSDKPGQEGLRVHGRVREVVDDKVWVIVNDGQAEGPISVPLARVRRIEYDLDGRRAELPAGDAAARYRFALWELSLGRKEEARFDLEAAVGKPGVPAEAFLALAKLQEELGELRKAWASYHAFLESKPDDEARLAEAREAIKRLKPRIDALPPEKDPAPPPADPVATDPANPKPPPDKPKVDEGLETYAAGWKAVPWADPATISLETDADTGNQFLAVQMSGEGKAASRKAGLQLRVGQTKRAELKSAKLTFFVYNPRPKTLPISVAFTTGGAGYFESRAFAVPGRKGWHTVTVDLNSSDFKSAETEWAYTTPVKDKNDLKSMIILINVREKLTIYLDYIKFVD